MGSSRITRRGSCSSARARSRRRRIPPESFGRADVALGAQVEDVDHLLGALGGRRAAHPVVAAVVDERLADGQEAVEVRLLLGDADQAPRLHGSRRVAEDAISPPVSRIRLQTALISVVLPAPFGPSRPKKLPAGTSRSRASRARVPSS